MFAENTKRAKDGIKLEPVEARRVAALIYTLKGRPFDIDAVKRSRNLMKSSTGVFSALRGNMSTCIATMLSLNGNPKLQFDHTVEVYDMMKNAGFWRSDFLAVAAYLVAESASPEDYQPIVNRMRSFYEEMKSLHVFNTGSDDIIFAAILALSDKDTRHSVRSVELLYQRLGPEFLAKNSVLALAQILAAGDMSDQAAADRVLALRSAFKAHKVPMDKAYTIPSLGILALLPGDVNTIVQDVAEAQVHLRAQKGYGALSVSKQELLLFAVAITASGYTEGVEGGLVTATVSTSIINIIISAQVTVAGGVMVVASN